MSDLMPGTLLPRGVAGTERAVVMVDRVDSVSDIPGGDERRESLGV